MRFANAQKVSRRNTLFAPRRLGAVKLFDALRIPSRDAQVIRRPRRPGGRCERENTMATSRGARGRGLPQAPQDWCHRFVVSAPRRSIVPVEDVPGINEQQIGISSLWGLMAVRSSELLQWFARIACWGGHIHLHFYSWL